MEQRRKRSNRLSDELRFNNGLDRALAGFMTYNRSRNLADSTLKYHENSIRELDKLIKHFNVDVEDLTENIVREYITYKLECGVKATTINQYLRTWRPFGNFLVRNKFAKINAFENISNLLIEKKLIETFSAEQVDKLLNTPDRATFTGFRDYVIMSLMLETGVRLSEAIGVKMNDVDFKAGLIRVFGKGRKERYVPFQDQMAQRLRKYIEYRGRIMHPNLFLSVENQPLKPRSFQDNMRKYGVKSRLPVRVSPHTLRHTFAKMYLLNGGDAFSLKNILGHTTLDMVSHYISLFSEDVATQHRKYSPLDRLMSERDV
ncbi:tyrosine-type recombinase/integrase [Marinicrinis sediminis]|uniref:Tyrosine-type recombinase/integrase n=1 Tax=Marinicrinis sediminis TaxID=1652465 RepID=A0ABW5RD82_9BACL